MDGFVARRPTIMLLRGLQLASLTTFEELFMRKFETSRADAATSAAPALSGGSRAGSAHAPNPAKSDSGRGAAGENPRVFLSLAQWPASTGCLCWHCDADFAAAPPVFVPTDFYCNPRGAEEFAAHGNFCSFPCAQAYINTVFHGNAHRDTYSRLLLKVFSVFNGRWAAKIEPAPPRTQMAQFSGPRGITPEQYREKISALTALANPPKTDLVM